MMRKLLILFMMLCCCYEAHAGELDGKYLSQSGELLFIFSGDSLYIDIAQSQRNVSAFKLVKNCENKSTTTFNAFEAYLKDGRETYREVLIKVTKLENKNYLLEYFGKDKDREYNSNERYKLDFIFKGMMIGVIASAPMGPVGILCVQRTLNKGRWYGLATGLGAAASDIIYAGFAGFGMSFVMDFITNDQNRFYLQIVGSVMLLCFGLYTYRSDPTKKMHQSGQQKGTLWYNSWTAFLVTFSNPLIVFLFLAMYAQFAFVLPDHPFEMVVGFASIVGGALLWWWGLTWLVDKIRAKFDTYGIKLINQVIGVAVIIGSVIMLLGTTTNLVRFF